jgi:hypothetical protein
VRHSTLLVTVAVVITAILVFIVAPGFADEGKVRVCHQAGIKDRNLEGTPYEGRPRYVETEVLESTLDAHLAHGDFIPYLPGTCGETF